jgi:hypothetical protein
MLKIDEISSVCCDLNLVGDQKIFLAMFYVCANKILGSLDK